MNRRMKALIVDDEKVARSRVASLLNAMDDIQVVAQFENGQEALDFLNSQRVDLLLVDVQMPILDGVSLVRAIPPAERPFVIFVTAYDQFAVDAFELFALDYLLKPYSKQRFQQAIDRFRLMKSGENPFNQTKQLEGLLAAYRQSQVVPQLSRISIKLGNRTYFIAMQGVEYILSSGNYLEVFAEQKVHIIRETMTRFIQKLPGNFLRVHKSSIVNTDFVAELIAIGYGDYELKMQNDKILRVSESYKQDLLRALNV
ncbi:MAG: response regulator transcription factor [Roseivirga sp.]|nr:response regulator transcription factor [Roseivirga sp.]